MKSTSDLKKAAQSIKVLLFDVDGVLTDGGIVYDNNGLESKRFNVKDGQIIRILKKANITTGVITGRKSEVVIYRCNELKIDYHYHGIHNKLEKLNELLDKLQVNLDEVAYIGDDINDLPILTRCGLSATPADGHFEVKARVDLVLETKGGDGALREFADFILSEREDYNNIIEEIITNGNV